MRQPLKWPPAASLGLLRGGDFLRRGHDDFKFLRVRRRHHVEIKLARTARRVGLADGFADSLRAAHVKLPAAPRPQEEFHQPFDVEQRDGIGFWQDDGFVAREQPVLTLQPDDQRHGAARFLRLGDVVAIEEYRRLEGRIQRGGEDGGRQIHGHSALIIHPWRADDNSHPWRRDAFHSMRCGL